MEKPKAVLQGDQLYLWFTEVSCVYLKKKSKMFLK